MVCAGTTTSLFSRITHSFFLITRFLLLLGHVFGEDFL
jgi:hypothetical protein